MPDDEWDTLKDFIPTSLINPMYNILKRKQLEEAENQFQLDDGFGEAKSSRSGYRRSMVPSLSRKRLNTVTGKSKKSDMRKSFGAAHS